MFWVTLLFGAILGMAFSVGVAVLFVLFRSARPSSSVLGRLPGTSVYRDITRFEKAEETKGILVFRFDAPLTFISVNYFSDLLSNQLALRPGTHTVVIDASSINDIDPTAVRMLLSLTREYQRQGVSMFFALWKVSSAAYMQLTIPITSPMGDMPHSFSLWFALCSHAGPST